LPRSRPVAILLLGEGLLLVERPSVGERRVRQGPGGIFREAQECDPGDTVTSRRETTTSGTASSERPVDVRPPTRRERFLHWLPWEKGLIWALVLLAVYVLRSFFLVIFLTFILAYTMRSIVAWVAGVILPARENVWLERALTLCCFALLLFGLYLAGNYFGPRLVKQGEQLVGQLKYLDRSEFQGALRQAVGPFLFDRRYGSETNEEYRKAFQEFLENDPPLVVEEFEKFGETAARLRRDFEIRLEADSARGLQELTGARRAEAFEPWFLASKAPEIYARDEGGWLERWEADYRSMAAATAQYGSPSLEDLEKQEDFEEQREALVYRFILREFPKREEAAWKALQEEWEEAVRQSAVDQFKAAPARYERRFEAHYKELHESDKSAFPHAYPTFIRLRDAHAEGMEAFSKVLSRRRTGTSAPRRRRRWSLTPCPSRSSPSSPPAWATSSSRSARSSWPGLSEGSRTSFSSRRRSLSPSS
jgi:hypothetical protein